MRKGGEGLGGGGLSVVVLQRREQKEGAGGSGWREERWSWWGLSANSGAKE